MVEHWCDKGWVRGSVTECGRHQLVRGVPSVAPLSERNHVTTEGVASTGQTSKKGTVSHREWFDGRVDAKARVKPVTAKLSDLRREANRGRSNR